MGQQSSAEKFKNEVLSKVNKIIEGKCVPVISVPELMNILDELTLPKIKITAHKWATEPQYHSWDKNHNHPYYDILENREFLPEDIHSISEAQKWLLINHPEYYLGCSIQEMNYFKATPDFLIETEPGYYERIYQTTDRNFIISKIKEELGITDELTQDQEERE